MFTDSDIAKNVTLGSTKVSYTVVHGLAPCFKEDLLKETKRSNGFVVCFDEALNALPQKCQMEFVIRFWDGKAER